MSRDSVIRDGIRSRSTPHLVSDVPREGCQQLTAEFRSGKANDLMTTLVSIFESRDAIIQELQTLLASRLLAVKDYDAVKEVSIRASANR